ncbi:erythromycin esterase family protein [Saccharopolyspora erythraea]|uniref:erythromycin esterase family protein n=1 Tax=Saccharopolyspora erythraea TaxID=1836 RepID=UPI00201164D2|nr:erythromycin esterase family protein [Saccharopolyspora erythraea]
MTDNSSPLEHSSPLDRAAVARWVSERAHPIATGAPGGDPLSDLESLRDIVGDAQVVGIGEATRFAHELFAVKFRLLRFLVERMGFRALMIEEDWTKAQQLDHHIRTGEGDVRALLDDVWGVWRTEEFVSALAWLRAYNRDHPGDPVRLVGIDYARVRADAYDVVLDHVRRHSPDPAEAERHYAELRPKGAVADHIDWFQAHHDKAGLLTRARRVHQIVSALPAHEGQADAEWNARIVAGFFAYHAGEHDSTLMADGIIRWHEVTGARIVYWGGTGHSAVHRPHGDTRTAVTDGTYLGDHFGTEYVSVGLTFDHGSLLWEVVPSSPLLAESVFAEVDQDAFVLDLRGPAPNEVRRWRDLPSRTRVIGPRYDAATDADHSLSGCAFGTWFDAVVHIREVTAVRFLEPARAA